MNNTQPHIPILVDAILDGLRVADTPNARWIDGTLGAGGHSAAILSARPDSQLQAFDLDPDALAIAGERLAVFGERAQLHHASYEQMPDFVAQPVEGILLDLGLSSMQLDRPERGFAFRFDGPLDMRFDPESDRPNAADLVNDLPADDLANLLYDYGEERDSRRITKAIIQARPVETTAQLAEIIAKASRTPRHKQTIHPATRPFQALRIAVNDELGAVARILPVAIDLLKSGGRLAVITFHSLEDRIVKEAFKLAATECICPPKQPLCTCDHEASIRLVTRKPIIADAEEVAANPRARSAKLRIVEKL